MTHYLCEGLRHQSGCLILPTDVAEDLDVNIGTGLSQCAGPCWLLLCRAPVTLWFVILYQLTAPSSAHSSSGFAALLLHVKETDVRLNIHMTDRNKK